MIKKRHRNNYYAARFRGTGTGPKPLHHEISEQNIYDRAGNKLPARAMPQMGDLVKAYCWCGKRQVDVFLDDVRLGLTESCGRSRCVRT